MKTSLSEQRAANSDQRDRQYSTTVRTVPVGLTLQVTPQVAKSGQVTLNVRPTVSRITRYRRDPNPLFSDSGVTNQVPEIAVREMESTLRVRNGETVAIGGLMEHQTGAEDQRVPLLSRIPLLGRLFRAERRSNRKSELLILLTSTAISQPVAQ